MNTEETIKKALDVMKQRKRVTEKGKEELEKLFNQLEKLLPDKGDVMSEDTVIIKWQHWDGQYTTYYESSHPDCLGVYVGARDGVMGLWDDRQYKYVYVAPYELTYVQWGVMADAIENFLAIMASQPTGEEAVGKIKAIREAIENLK